MILVCKFMDIESEINPKRKKYVISKEIHAVSLQDALRKERHAVVFEAREVLDDEE